MNLGTHEWNCLREGCKKFIMAYSEQGLRVLVEQHMDQHYREDREERLKANASIVYAGPARDYNVLKLTAKDIGFLKTRGVQIDQDIEWDLSVETKPSTAELKQKKWAAVLEKAWSR